MDKLLRRRGWVIGGVTVLHTVLWYATALMSVGMVLGRFDTGVPPSPGEKVVDNVLAVLSFPLLTLLNWLPIGGLGPGWLQIILVSANSLVWGGGVWYIAFQLKQRFFSR